VVTQENFNIWTRNFVLCRLENRILSLRSFILAPSGPRASPKLTIEQPAARWFEFTHALLIARSSSNHSLIAYKKTAKSRGKRATCPPCVRVRASASQKGDGARSDRERESERREKKREREAARDSHCVHTRVYVCVCLRIGVSLCMCREGYFFEKPLDERETHLDRGSVLPGHRKLSRAAHLARERERERERDYVCTCTCVYVCVCMCWKGERVKECRSEGPERRQAASERTRMRRGRRGREGQRQRVLSRALLNIVAYTELPDRRAHTHTQTQTYTYMHECVRASARKQRVIKGLEGRRSASAWNFACIINARGALAWREREGEERARRALKRERERKGMTGRERESERQRETTKGQQRQIDSPD